MAELVPVPLSALLRRAHHEFGRRGAIFDLPARKFRRRVSPAGPVIDLSVPYAGTRAANPIGPAAGPHTQLAQNLALVWLAGARIFELKTIQVKDRLTLSRPCIDMATVGYNTEWSQELRLEESLREYVKGAMLIEILGAGGWGPDNRDPGFGVRPFDRFRAAPSIVEGRDSGFACRASGSLRVRYQRRVRPEGHSQQGRGGVARVDAKCGRPRRRAAPRDPG